MEKKDECGWGCGVSEERALRWCSRPADLTGCGWKFRKAEKERKEQDNADQETD